MTLKRGIFISDAYFNDEFLDKFCSNICEKLNFKIFVKNYAGYNNNFINFSCIIDFLKKLHLLIEDWRYIDFLVFIDTNRFSYNISDNLMNLNSKDFIKDLGQNLYDFIEIIKHVYKFMKFGGSIIKVNNGLGDSEINDILNCMYKKMIRYLSRPLGASNIRVNSILCDTFFKNDFSMNAEKIQDYQSKFTAIKKNITVDDLISSILFLISDDSSKISGTEIDIGLGLSYEFFKYPLTS